MTKEIQILNAILKNKGLEKSYKLPIGEEVVLSLVDKTRSNGTPFQDVVIVSISLDRILRPDVNFNIAEEEVYMKELYNKGRFEVKPIVINISNRILTNNLDNKYKALQKDTIPTIYNAIIEFFAELEAKGYKDVAIEIDSDLEFGIYHEVIKI